MICGTLKQLQECGHGQGYIDAVFARGIHDGDEVCIDDETLQEIRQQFAVATPKPGLGDRLASLLARIGIHPWPGCGCAGRKRWLNEFGRRIGL